MVSRRSCKCSEDSNSLKSAYVQVAIVGVLAFTGPGMFNALSGLGAAGSGDPRVGAIMNSTLYGFFSVVGYFSGAAFSIIGPRMMFMIGGFTYAVYAVCAYFSDKGDWVAALGGTVLGCGAGLFWTAQGAIMMAYATPDEKGLFIRNFWIIFNLGGVFGGILTMFLNMDVSKDTGQANPASYCVFTVVMIAGAALSQILLVSPSEVRRSDDSTVTFKPSSGALEEIKAAALAVTDPFVLKMLPFFFASNWFYTYEFSGFNNMLFNVRTRGLNSGLFWAAQMIGATLLQRVTDHKTWSMQKRGCAGYATNAGFVLTAWVCALVVTYTLACDNGWDKGEGQCYPDPSVTKRQAPCDLGERYEIGCDIDMATFSQYIGPCLAFLLMGMQDSVFQSYCYWLMGAAAGENTSKNVMYAACYKGVQSLGAAVAWSTDLLDEFKYEYQMYTGILLSLLCLIPVYFALSDIVPLEAYGLQANDREASVELTSRVHPENSQMLSPSSQSQPEISQLLSPSSPTESIPSVVVAPPSSDSTDTPRTPHDDDRGFKQFVS